MSHFANVTFCHHQRGDRAAPVSNQRKPSGNIERAAPIYPASRGGSTVCAGFVASLSGDRSTVANIERRATIERGERAPPVSGSTVCAGFVASLSGNAATAQPFRPVCNQRQAVRRGNLSGNIERGKRQTKRRAPFRNAAQPIRQAVATFSRAGFDQNPAPLR